MTRHQFDEGKRPPDMEGSCEYIEWPVVDSQQEVVHQLGGLSEMLTTPYSKNLLSFETFHTALSLEWSFGAQDKDRRQALTFLKPNGYLKHQTG
jgi:hypothetical protein